MAVSSTSFKKGNQAAKDCETSGRPRTVSLEPSEMIKLGQEMVEWVKENNPLHLSEWYTMQKHFTNKQWETFKDKPEFVPYYQEAISYVRKNYIDGTVNSSIAHRFIRIYYPEVRDEENETAAFNANLKVTNEESPKDEELDLKAKFYKSEYEKQQLQKELDDLKSKASPELQRSDSSL